MQGCARGEQGAWPASPLLFVLHTELDVKWLQAEAEDADAGAAAEQQQQQQQQAPAPAPVQVAAQPYAPPPAQQLQQPPFQHQQQQQQPPPAAPLGPLARATQFRIPPPMVGGAPGQPQQPRPADSASSTLAAGQESPFGATSSRTASPMRQLGGPLAGAVLAQQSRPQLPAAQQQQQQQWQPPQQQQQQPPQQPMPPSPQPAPREPPPQLQLPPEQPAFQAAAGLEGSAATPAGAAAALRADPTGHALLSALEEEGPSGPAAQPAPSPVSARTPGAAPQAGPAGEDVDAAARQNVVEVRRASSRVAVERRRGGFGMAL